MIEKNEEKSFNSCNACGKYNMQPNFDDMKVEECGKIYDYLAGSMHVRFCKECAKDMLVLLLKQIMEE